MPSTLELVLPWNLSPTVLLAIALAAGLYGRGITSTAPPPSIPRRIAYFCGLALIYAALQTSCEYFASHMFFVLQLQHFTLHDLAPALLAVAAPGAALASGLPKRLQARLPAVARTLRGPSALLADPVVATVIYFVTQLIWFVPPIAFDAMISNWLYRVMSWSVLLGGIPFWHLMLDLRPYPLARLRLRYRFVILYLAMVPMMLLSAALAFSQTDWYPVYAVCGRFLPIPPVADQQLGGMAMGIPGQLLFGIVLFLALGRRLERTHASASAIRGGMNRALPVRTPSPGAENL